MAAPIGQDGDPHGARVDHELLAIGAEDGLDDHGMRQPPLMGNLTCPLVLGHRHVGCKPIGELETIGEHRHRHD